MGFFFNGKTLFEIGDQIMKRPTLLKFQFIFFMEGQTAGLSRRFKISLKELEEVTRSLLSLIFTMRLLMNLTLKRKSFKRRKWIAAH